MQDYCWSLNWTTVNQISENRAKLTKTQYQQDGKREDDRKMEMLIDIGRLIGILNECVEKPKRDSSMINVRRYKN